MVNLQMLTTAGFGQDKAGARDSFQVSPMGDRDPSARASRVTGSLAPEPSAGTDSGRKVKPCSMTVDITLGALTAGSNTCSCVWCLNMLPSDTFACVGYM